MSENSQTQNHKGGVKTDEGKAISRYNAQKHCILRQTPTPYEEIEAEDVFNDLFEEMKPDNMVQEVVLQIIVNNVIKLARIARAEGEAIMESVTEPKYKLTDNSYLPLVSTHYAAEKLLLYSRYQTATENRLYRALQEFKKLKNEQS